MILEMSNKESIYCGGLQWILTVHPNQEQPNRFSLSVCPINQCSDDFYKTLRNCYSLQYTVTTEVISRSAVFPTKHQWTRQIDQVFTNMVSDDKPHEESKEESDCEDLDDLSLIDWKSQMELFPLSVNDLMDEYCGDKDDFFYLEISIQTKFIKNSSTSKFPSYLGVFGALLLQSETEINSLKKQINESKRSNYKSLIPECFRIYATPISNIWHILLMTVSETIYFLYTFCHALYRFEQCADLQPNECDQPEHLKQHTEVEISAILNDDPQEINVAEASKQSQDDRKQFAFDHNEEAPVESPFSSRVTDRFQDKCSATNWGTTFGGGDQDRSDEKADKVNEESNSFANISWNLGGDTTISTFDTNTTAATTQQPAGDTNADTNTNNASNNNDEDNMAECTFKPIVQLEEQHVATGHENETLIAKCHYTKLYRFGPDVSRDMGWKNRGSQSEVSFYKDNSTGAVRMISREHITNKLRMNQMVYPEDKASFTKKTPKMYSWTAFDVTIATEEKDVNKGQSAWLIKFGTEELAMEFAGHFRVAMQMNANVEETPVDDASKPETLELMDGSKGSQEVVKITENDTSQQNVESKKNAETSEEVRVKAWQQPEIYEDKARRATAVKDAQSAALFQSNDADAPQTVSWSMDTFGEGDDNNAEDNVFGNLKEKSREEKTSGPCNFNRNGTKTDLGGDSGDEADANWNEQNESDSVIWGDVGGGFSSVKPTEGWANAGWGNDNNAETSGGWGSFENTNFNLERMMQVGATLSKEGDIRLDSFEIMKIYRWGKDAEGLAGWQSRAIDTTIDIWQQPNKGKVRVICRENATNKLRLDHWLPQCTTVDVQLRAEQYVQWGGLNTIIHTEEKDDRNGFCMCKLRDGETAKKFYALLLESMQASANDEETPEKRIMTGNGVTEQETEQCDLTAKATSHVLHTQPACTMSNGQINEDEMERGKINITLTTKSQETKSPKTRNGELAITGTLDSPTERITCDVDPDPEYDELELKHRPVRPWKYDAEQKIWRDCGEGVVLLYLNKKRKLGKLIFIDEKHDKIRLLQWIKGDRKCVHCPEVISPVPDVAALNVVHWFGADHTLNPMDPVIGQWKLDFMENEDAAKQFVCVFNTHIAIEVAKKRVKCAKIKADARAQETEDDKNRMTSFTNVKLIQRVKEVNDTTGHAEWKNKRCIATIDFWQQPNTGKVRVMCRDQITKKLTVNHCLPDSDTARAKLTKVRIVQWNGFNTTTRCQGEDDNNEYNMFSCVFSNGETAKKFYDLLAESIENN